MTSLFFLRGGLSTYALEKRQRDTEQETGRRPADETYRARGGAAFRPVSSAGLARRCTYTRRLRWCRLYVDGAGERHEWSRGGLGLVAWRRRRRRA